jgi:importin-9
VAPLLKLLVQHHGESTSFVLMDLYSYVVGKIATIDFPEQWPNLLPSLLHMIPTASDTQLYGALKVLAELVDDSLSDNQFFSVARDVVKVVYDVAINSSRKTSLRALAVSVFRGCFDIMEMVKDEHGPEVKGFADEVLSAWSPFFLGLMKMPLPPRQKSVDEYQSASREPEEWGGIIALKVQVVKTLMKIRLVFPQTLLPQSPVLFTATWEELLLLQEAYQDMYIDHDEQGRLEDSDGLPYTLDFLVLEELDFLQSCFRASPVQKELEAQLQANSGVQGTPWVLDVMKLAVAYAQITSEEEGLWDIDVNLFLAEETSVTANYTARTACGDLLIKLGEWLHQGTLQGLLAYTKSLFADPHHTWRTRESSLFLLTQLMNDFLDVDKAVPIEIASAYLELIDYAVNRPDEYLLRARGYLVAGILVQSVSNESFPVIALLDRTIKAINDDESEVVKVACIKAIQGLVKAPISVPTDRQVPIVMAISDFMNAKDLTELEEADDLLVTLVESLRAAIILDPRISIHPGSGVLDLLFLMAKHGAASYQLTALVNDTFEEIVTSLSSMGKEGYVALCEKVLPSLTGAFDVGNITGDNPLTTVSTRSVWRWNPVYHKEHY